MNAAVGFLVDTAIMAIAYAAAFLLRFDFHAPGWGWARVWTSFITVWSVQLAALIAFDCLRRWRVRARDIGRFSAAFASALVVLIGLRVIFRSESQIHIRPPYTVNLINGFIWATGAMAARWLWTKFVNARNVEARLLNRKERSVIDDSVKA